MKGENDAAIINNLAKGIPHAQYFGFFECFNQQLFYEAHQILEPLWLPQRLGPDGAFFKGLIQLAGAFVHLQKGRANPALALLRLARANLKKYRGLHHQLDIPATLALIDDWRARIETASSAGTLLNAQSPSPKLNLG